MATEDPIDRNRVSGSERAELPVENTAKSADELTTDELSQASGGKGVQVHDISIVHPVDKSSTSLS